MQLFGCIHNRYNATAVKILRSDSADEFVNWSGSLRFTPQMHVAPRDESALQDLVRDAAASGKNLRVAGSGHSSSPLVATADVLVSLDHMQGLLYADKSSGQALIAAGTVLKDLGRALHEAGLGMENLGDVDTQTLAGVVGTGTHGSGRRLRNISAQVIGVRAVTGTGEIAEWSVEQHPQLLQALRVALGALGVFTAIRMQLQPAYQLCRREYWASTAACLENLDALADLHRNFDFYWYPRRDEVKIRTLNPPSAPLASLPFARICEETGFSHEVIARVRELRFEEMEYFVPARVGPACFREVRRRILERHRKHVGWRVLYRLVAADDAYLSPAYGRDSVAISIHQNATLPFQEYFDDIEPIFRNYNGRPHWGKRHSLSGEALARHYPQWQRFMELRRQLDPSDVFLSGDLAHLFGEARAR